MKLIVILLLFVSYIISPTRVLAEDFVIDAFHSDVKIQKDGVVQIEETIKVDFSKNEKHGIYRDLPYVYASGDKKTYSEINVLFVMRGVDREKYKVEKNDANLRIRIGDADKTISGKQEYRISYNARGILKGFETFDELYWNTTGNDWLTPNASATATVLLPTTGLISAKCYQGYGGYQEECLSSITDTQTAAYSSTRLLQSSEGMTIVAAYEKGLVPLLVIAEPEKYPFFKWKYFYTFLATFLVGTLFVISLWYREGRDIWSSVPLALTTSATGKNKPLGKKDAVVVEFTPPEKLRPAEIGVLLDERADTLDVTATIIDLATRGYMTVKEVEKSWIFGKTDHELTETKKDRSQLLPYENLLLTYLFESGSTIKISDLKMTFYAELKKVKDRLYDTVVSKGYFAEHPEEKRSKFLLIAIILATVSFVVLMNMLTHYFILSFLLGVVMSSIMLFLFSRSMSRRSVMGSDLYRRALGYRLFINGAEKYRQQFFEKKNMMNDILPYTIVFGLTDKFANAMEKMGIEGTRPTWYTGVHPFTYSAFASDMSSFSSSMSSAISSAPSSSGSSGGGSSGGGFGGGGGGSW